MLDTETKRRIDTARDILVGKVPDPKSQVEQITIALIYKFMDDMDAESEELGGKRKFFTGDFARYGWAKLMRSGLGGHETLNLYAEGITKMPENPGIPLLFREIFKNAYLPYRDPETLKAFLKIIDDFTYDHSERLGDAFEYLLSVLGSQGDAGQFRTPRHIIDFIVDIINPQKHETVLDPACGTAGFLISAYKHILQQNVDEKGHSTLTPDERGKLATNFKGYDISPDMVRLSLVNLYLHGFTDPHVYEYDTLTSEERWNEYADVILANPPFMSPKGGIKPHKRFSVQSKRSEVLFVDYMAEHLSPTGRAGIIVPEGVVFQTQGSYVELRKMLVENSLVAVISLPAGVFNPYSGVKTCILILDKSIARSSKTIGFFKVENDGFGLGTQRRAFDKNDVPKVTVELGAYLKRLRNGHLAQQLELRYGLLVEKHRIGADGDFILSGERYRESESRRSSFRLQSIGEIAVEIKAGFASGQSSVRSEGVPHIRPMNVTDKGQFTWSGLKRITESEFAGREDYALRAGDILFNNTNSRELVGKTCLVDERIDGGYSNHMTRIRTKLDMCAPRFLALMLHNAWLKGHFLERANKWVGQAGINATSLSEFQIPLPPLGIQQEVVAEIEGYQRVIDGAKAVLDNYSPNVSVDLDWPMVAIGDIVEFVSGLTVSIPEVESEAGTPIVAINNVTEQGELTLTGLRRINPPRKTLNYLQKGDLLFNWRNGSKHLVGKTALFDLDGPYLFASFLLGIRVRPELVDPHYLWHTLNIYRREGKYMRLMRQNVNGLFNREELKVTIIPLPDIHTQRRIAAEIEAERALVASNRELVSLFERKIDTTLTRVWGAG